MHCFADHLCACMWPTNQHAVAEGGPHSTLDLLGHELGDCETVVLSNVVQQTQSMVLHRGAGKGTSDEGGLTGEQEN